MMMMSGTVGTVGTVAAIEKTPQSKPEKTMRIPSDLVVVVVEVEVTTTTLLLLLCYHPSFLWATTQTSNP